MASHWVEDFGSISRSLKKKLSKQENRGILNHPECPIFTTIKTWLLREVATILTFNQKVGYSSEVIARAPPVKPKGGECFLIEWDLPTGPFDLRKDQWGAWQDQGTSKRSKVFSLKTFYITHGSIKGSENPFKKHLSHLLVDEKEDYSKVYFLQYLGDHTQVVPRSHGNTDKDKPYSGGVMPFVRERMREAGRATGPSNAVFHHNSLWNEGSLPRVPAARANAKLLYNLNHQRVKKQQATTPLVGVSASSSSNTDLDQAVRILRQLFVSGSKCLLHFSEIPLLIVLASEYELALLKFCCTREGKYWTPTHGGVWVPL